MKKTTVANKQRNTFILLWEVMTKKDKLNFFGLMLLGVISSIAILIPTQIVSIVISKLSGNSVSFFGISIPDTWGYVTIIIIGGVVTYLMYVLNLTYGLKMEALTKRVVCNLRSHTYGWLVSPRKNMDLKMTQGDALYRMNEGPENIVSVVDSFFSEVIPQVLSAIFAFIYVCIIDVLSMPFIVVGLLIVFLCVYVRTKLERSISINMETTKSAVSNSVANSITNLPVITLYKSMFFEQHIFDRKIEDYYKQQKKQIDLRWVYWTLVRLVEIICTFSIIFVCAERIFAGTMDPGSIVVIVNYVSQIYTPIQTVGYFSTKWVQCSVKIQRLYEIKPNKQDLLPLQALEVDKINSLELKNINVQNGDVFRIENVNARFVKGQMTVIYGESGCGKSTIMRVVSGLCERQSGEIIINDSQDLSTAYLISDKMSVTMQSPYIFNRDVKLNVLYPDGENYKDVKEIIDLFGMNKLYNRKFNEKRQQNLENMLSGGEKKRVCIARGLLKPADIYIFDEPTNDLDHKNAMNVIRSINKLKKDAIVIVVSHDERVMKRADQLIEFNNKVMVNPDTSDEE